MNLLLLFACSQESPKDSEPANTLPLTLEPATQLDDPCDAALAGTPGESSFAADFSRAHADARFFGPAADWLSADEVLVSVLDGDDPFITSTLDAYAAEIDDLCALAARNDPLGAVVVEQLDTTAWITPGTGTVTISDDTTIVAIDLRTLPATADGDAALDAAVAVALGGEVDVGKVGIRKWSGFPTQWTANVYSTDEKTIDLDIIGTSSVSRDLVFFTGPQLSPHAAKVAGGLRVIGRATIIGYDIHTAVAESSWAGIGDGGLLFRAGLLQSDDEVPWPDRIPADVPTSTPENAVENLADYLIDTPLTGDATRSGMEAWDAMAGTQDTALTVASMRAAMMVAHGTLERFWPYFDVVDNDLDAALTTALDEIDGLSEGDREGMLDVLGRFQHELYDGHAFYGDWFGGTEPTGYFALQIQQVDGKPVVRASAHEGIHAGDTIVSIDGVDAAEWYAEAMGRYSAATDGYLFDLACREMLVTWGSRTFELEDPDGNRTTVTPTPVSYEESYVVPWGGTYRESGWLDDLGAPDILYLNMNGTLTTDWEAQIEPILAELPNAAGLVIDMRDYPGINHYQLVPYLRTESFTSPIFGYPIWEGPDLFSWDDSFYSYSPSSAAFGGPKVLLVSNKSVSAAENFSQMLFPDPTVTVVGQPSAATNGNITGGYLPGGFYMMFTGMRILNADGSQFHGIGIPVEVEVVPTPAQFRDGIDPELAAALTVLSSG